MKTTHTLSAIEATAYALRNTKVIQEIKDTHFSKVKPEKTIDSELENISKMATDLSIEVKDKLEKVLNILKNNENEETTKAIKIIVDLLY